MVEILTPGSATLTRRQLRLSPSWPPASFPTECFNVPDRRPVADVRCNTKIGLELVRLYAVVRPSSLPTTGATRPTGFSVRSSSSGDSATDAQELQLLERLLHQLEKVGLVVAADPALE